MIKPIGSTVEKYQNIVVVDRGHHLEHMILLIEDRIKGLTAHKYAKQFVDSMSEQYQESVRSLNYLNYLKEKYSELLNTKWFMKVCRAIVHSAYSYTRNPNIIDDETGEITTYDIEVLLTGVLSYFTNKISPNIFEVLFENGSDIFNRKSADHLKVWQIDLTYVDEVFESLKTDIQSIDISLFSSFIQLTLYVFETNVVSDLLLPLLNGPEHFHKILDEYIMELQAELDYYRDIQISDDTSKSRDTYETTFKFSKKILDSLRNNTEGLIILNTNPGLLCKYEGRNKFGCARHCLKHFNKKGDKDYLAVIELFTEEYPEYADLFRITRINGEVVEVAFPVKILVDEDFRRFVLSHANSYEITDDQDFDDDDLDDEF